MLTLFINQIHGKKNALNNFNLKNCFFGVTNIVKSTDKAKWVYSGYRIPFDGSAITELW